MTRLNYSGSRSYLISDYCQTLEQISRCITKLSNRYPSASNFEARELQRLNLRGVLSGEKSNLSYLHRVPELFNDENMGTLSHLGTISAKRIGCDYSEVFESPNITALDLHISDDSWCNICLEENNRTIDLKSGQINRYSCWRRGISSGHFGFIVASSLKLSKDRIDVMIDDIYCSRELEAALYVHSKFPNVHSTKENEFETKSMICTINVNTKLTAENDTYSEIKAVPGQQLLQSKNFKPTEELSSNAYRNRNINIPQYIENLLQEINKKWRLSGSKNRTGIIGLATINNRCEFVDSPVMRTALENYCAENKIKYQSYNLEDLNSSLSEKKLKLTSKNLPLGSFNIVIILDPLIDLGGMQFDE